MVLPQEDMMVMEVMEVHMVVAVVFSVMEEEAGMGMLVVAMEVMVNQMVDLAEAAEAAEQVALVVAEATQVGQEAHGQLVELEVVLIIRL